MARTGRPRKPSVLKLLAGNPGKRKINRREPKIAGGTLTTPAWLGKAAKAEWRRLVKVLPRGLVTQGDRQVFAQYCQTVGRLAAAERALDESGSVFITGDAQYPMPHPNVKIVKDLHQTLRGLMSDLGLTPASRSKVEIDETRKPIAPPVEAPQQHDRIEEFLFGNRRSS